MSVDFDEHASIEYRDITRLYWNAYPYKVLVRDNVPPPRGQFGSLYRRYRHLRKEFYYKRKRHCPKDVGSWRSMDNGNSAKSFSFFFKDEAEAKHFITRNRRHVAEVFRPTSADQIEALRQGRQFVLRDRLYWDKYRYCVEFKAQFDHDNISTFDNAVLALFNNRKNGKRYMYSFSCKRRLYLNVENDIYLVKMAFPEFFNSYTEVILKKDIP